MYSVRSFCLSLCILFFLSVFLYLLCLSFFLSFVLSFFLFRLSFFYFISFLLSCFLLFFLYLAFSLSLSSFIPSFLSFVFLFAFTDWPIYLPTYPCVIYLPIYVFSLSIHPSIHVSIYLPGVVGTQEFLLGVGLKSKCNRFCCLRTIL